MQVLHDFALWRFQRAGNSRLNVNKISLPLAQDSQLLLQRSTVTGRCSVELCAGKRGVNPDFVTIWQLSRMCCTPFNSNINDRWAIFREALSFAIICKNVACISCVPCVMPHCPSFGPAVYRRMSWLLSLPQPSKTKYSRFVALSEYIPPAKIHRPCFLNLAQWSVYLEWKCSERRSRGVQHSWLKGEVMTLAACVFGSCETTAGAPHNCVIITPYYYSHRSLLDIDCCWNALHAAFLLTP